MSDLGPDTSRRAATQTDLNTGPNSGAAAQKPVVMGFEVPTGTDPHSIRQRLEALEVLLERSFRIPGINVPIGLDGIVGLVPVLGDIVTTTMSAYMVWEARNLGLPRWKLWRMAGNIGVDTLLGLVPIVGDAADFMFRSNTRNLRIIKQHLDKHHPASKVVER